MTVWLSSGENHSWNPGTEIACYRVGSGDRSPYAREASSMDVKKRKEAVDRVQEIVWQQEPFIYLVNKDAMSAVSTNLHNVHPVALRPQVYSGYIEQPPRAVRGQEKIDGAGVPPRPAAFGRLPWKIRGTQKSQPGIAAQEKFWGWWDREVPARARWLSAS